MELSNYFVGGEEEGELKGKLIKWNRYGKCFYDHTKVVETEIYSSGLMAQKEGDILILINENIFDINSKEYTNKPIAIRLDLL